MVTAMTNLFETQKLIEVMYNKNQEYDLVSKDFINEPELMKVVNQENELGLPPEFFFDILVKMAVQTDVLIDTLLGQLVKYAPDDLSLLAQGIVLAAERDLINMSVRFGKIAITAIYVVDHKTRSIIKQYQYMLPMLVQPKEVTSNKGSGYLTKTDDSLILKNNHHDGDIALDSINKFNSIPLALNERVIRNIRDTRKSLSKPKEDESIEDWKERVADFERMEKESMNVFAVMINNGNRFYLTHKVDKRGRTYAQGYHISYQGNTYRKAVIELADKELIDE